MSKDTISLAVAGVGGWGRNVLRCMGRTQGARICAICDANDKSLKAQGANFPGVKLTNNYEEILDDPGIDAVVLAVPSPMHAPMAKQALEAGKHVYVEKPMALSGAEAEELVAVSEVNKLTLMVGRLL